MDIRNINDERIRMLAERTISTLDNMKKLVVFCHDANFKSDPWRRHVSLWIIHDGNEAYNLADLVEAMEVEERMKSRNDQFSVSSVEQFVQDFIRQLDVYFGATFDAETDIERYYRFLAA